MAALKARRSQKSAEQMPTITDKAMFEIVDGRLEEMEPMSVYAINIAFLLASEIQFFARSRGMGRATTEQLFRLPLSRPRSRRPDAAFVSEERWPMSKAIPIAGNSWDVVPDLAIEVVSPSDRISKLELKLTEYFEAGVRHVWVIHPEHQIIEVYKSRHEIQMFKVTDELKDEDVLPGFRLPVGSVFPPAIGAADERGDD